MLNLFRATCLDGLPPGFRLLEMGSTQIYGSVAEFSALFEYLRVPEPKRSNMAADYGSRSVPSGLGAYNLEVMPSAGVRYDCVDYFDPTTIKADLNSESLPGRLRGAFDLVTNFGTSEHVADQMNFFRYLHDATKIGGVMVHMVPMVGYVSHCLYKYDFKFFERLAAANEYEILYAAIGPQTTGVTFEECRNWVGYEAVSGRRFDSHLVEFILRKRHTNDFRPPFDANPTVLPIPPDLAPVRSFPPRLAFTPFVEPPQSEGPPRSRVASLWITRLNALRYIAAVFAKAALGDAEAAARIKRRLMRTL
jgi:hypothetical protein